MTNEASTRWLSSWRLWVGSLLLWTLVLVLEQSGTYTQGEDGHLVWTGMQWRFLLQHAVWYMPAVPGTVLLAWCAPRLVHRPRFWLSFVGLVAGTSLLSAVWLNAWQDIGWPMLGLGWVIHYGPRFATVLGVLVVLELARLRERNRRELLTAQLRVLRSQLQPHFLFNTLHTIGVTAKQDGAAAARMTTLLGDLLRQTLQEREQGTVPLAQELELLQPYLQLQQLRFGDRLQLTIDVPADMLGAEVPDLVLQPLVENALRHGIERLPGAGSVVIRARRSGPFLRLQVIDDGAGLDGNAHDGTGLGATRARLQAMYGDTADLELAPTGVRGTTVTLRLPFRGDSHAA